MSSPLTSPFLKDVEAPLTWSGAHREPRAVSARPLSRASSSFPRGVAIERHNMGPAKLTMALLDPFHTLVNMPARRFFPFFLASYMAMYVFYAALYYTQPGCISMTSTFLHCLWFSVHTSATIGYGHMAPRPSCTMLQVFVLLEVLTTILLQAVLMGVVYARFSSPDRRAHSIRFSRTMTLRVGADGYSRLAFRVANLRKHQVLRPELRMLLLRKQKLGGGAEEEWVYTDLPVRHAGGSGRLWLGVPTLLRHVVDERSPLYGVGLQDMECWGWEIVVLLDGYDESTSMPVQARQAYRAADIEPGAAFEPMMRRLPSGLLRVDFESFDRTGSAAAGQWASSEEGSQGDPGDSLGSELSGGLAAAAAAGAGAGARRGSSSGGGGFKAWGGERGKLAAVAGAVAAEREQERDFLLDRELSEAESGGFAAAAHMEGSSREAASPS